MNEQALNDDNGQKSLLLENSAVPGKTVRAKGSSGGFQLLSLGDKLAGEDFDNDVIRVENQFSYARATGDLLVATGPSLIHAINIAATGAVTAGVLSIFNNTAESGTPIWSALIGTGTTIVPPVILDEVCSLGIYIGFDATLAGIQVNMSFRV